MNKTNTNSLSVTYPAQSHRVAPAQVLDQGIENRDSATARFARKFFERTASLYTKITAFQKLKTLRHSTMSLYKFHKNDAMSSTAGRIALYFATFCTGGLLAAGLLVYDVAHNFTLESDKKREICHIIDQLASCVCVLRSEVSDAYKKMTGGRKEMIPLRPRGETPSKKLQRLKLPRLNGNEMYESAVSIVEELQLEIDMLKTHVEELAQDVEIEKESESFPLSSHTTLTSEQLDKDISSVFQAKATSLTRDIECLSKKFNCYQSFQEKFHNWAMSLAIREYMNQRY